MDLLYAALFNLALLSNKNTPCSDFFYYMENDGKYSDQRHNKIVATWFCENDGKIYECIKPFMKDHFDCGSV